METECRKPSVLVFRRLSSETSINVDQEKND